MPTLAQIVGQLESGSGRDIASQPSRMVNPYYGQYSGFVNQYGSGAAGINNFAAQVLARNPNATVGDFYASYVRGTGTPGQYSWQDLLNVNSGGQAGAQGAASNFLNNAGVSPNTPLASFIGSPTATSPVDAPQDFIPNTASSSQNFQSLNVIPNTDQTFDFNNSATFNERFGALNQPSALSFDPNAIGAQTSFGSSVPDFSGFGSSAGSGGHATIEQAAASGGGLAASQPMDPGNAPTPANALTGGVGKGAGGAISGQGQGVQVQIGPQPGLTGLVDSAIKNVEGAFGAGTKAVTAAAQGVFSSLSGELENWFVRWGLVILGVVIVVVALAYLMAPDNTAQIAAALAHAAA